MDQETEYLRIREVERKSRHSRTRIYGLLAEGKIAAIKVGRLTLISRRSLESYLAELPAYKSGRAVDK